MQVFCCLFYQHSFVLIINELTSETANWQFENDNAVITNVSKIRSDVNKVCSFLAGEFYSAYLCNRKL